MPIVEPTNKSVLEYEGIHLYHGNISNCSMRVRMTLEEKKHFLSLAEEKKYLLFLEHDVHNELISLRKTEKGIRLNEQHRLNSFF